MSRYEPDPRPGLREVVSSVAVVVGLVAVACWLLAFVGCTLMTGDTVLAPSQVQTVTQTGGDKPAPAASASPTAACPGAPDRVAVGFYAFSGCASSAPYLPVGCTGLATATPKLASGQDDPRFDATTPTWTVVSGPLDVISPGGEANPFNAFLRWRTNTALGAVAIVEATVCGVTGRMTAIAGAQVQ